jgi:hypothetical protein
LYPAFPAETTSFLLEQTASMNTKSKQGHGSRDGNGVERKMDVVVERRIVQVVGDQRLKCRESNVGGSQALQFLEFRKHEFTYFRKEGHRVPVHIKLDIVLRDEDGNVRQQTMTREIRNASSTQVLTGYPRLKVPFEMSVVRTQHGDRRGFHEVDEEPVVHQLVDVLPCRFNPEGADALREVKFLMVEGAETRVFRMFLKDSISFTKIQTVNLETSHEIHRRHLRCISEVRVGDSEDVIVHVRDEKGVVGKWQRKRM